MPNKVTKATAVGHSVPASKTFLYVTRHTRLYLLLKKVRRELILKDAKRFTLCGMGAAIAHASSLALKIQDMIGGETSCHLEIRTGTQQTTDRIMPEDEEDGEELQKNRNLSTIQIDIVAGKT